VAGQKTDIIPKDSFPAVYQVGTIGRQLCIAAYSNRKRLVAMSGGIDSTITALMLHDGGCEVVATASINLRKSRIPQGYLHRLQTADPWL
jgi:hypothetical protein